MVKHDESKCINSLRRVAMIAGKTIQAPKTNSIGIKRWGMIDYLCHYCGYTFIWNNNSIIDKSSYENKDKKKELKEIKNLSRKKRTFDDNKNVKPNKRK